MVLKRNGEAYSLPPAPGLPWWLSCKESACNVGDLGLVPGLGRSPGEEKGYPLQYSGLENSMGSQRVGHDWATFTCHTCHLGHLAISGDNSGCHNWGVPVALSGYRPGMLLNILLIQCLGRPCGQQGVTQPKMSTVPRSRNCDLDENTAERWQVWSTELTQDASSSTPTQRCQQSSTMQNQCYGWQWFWDTHEQAIFTGPVLIR